jgi:hypothetical protein
VARLLKSTGPKAKAAGDIKALEAEADALFAACFNTPAGEKVMQYLTNKTVNFVSQLGAPMEIVYDQQGQRRIVAEIIQRAKRGKK